MQAEVDYVHSGCFFQKYCIVVWSNLESLYVAFLNMQHIKFIKWSQRHNITHRQNLILAWKTFSQSLISPKVNKPPPPPPPCFLQQIAPQISQPYANPKPCSPKLNTPGECMLFRHISVLHSTWHALQYFSSDSLIEVSILSPPDPHPQKGFYSSTKIL